MRRLALLVLLAMVSTPATASATLIELSQNYTLGSIANRESGEGQVLNHTHQYFDPIVFGLGDTLVFTFQFDKRLQVFDYAELSDEAFSLQLGIASGSPGFSGTWFSSIEALGGQGDIWSGPISMSWRGGGGGIGWGGQGINVTSRQGSFTGLRWTLQLTSATEGVPMTLNSSALTLHADRIEKVPRDVPELGSTLLLFGIGLAALRARGKRR